jgi:RNA 2',3'-cyclic 3'-phosphodiesterase
VNPVPEIGGSFGNVIRTDPQSPRLPISPSPLLPSSTSAWRIFCAIEIPKDIRSQLEDRIRRLDLAVPQNEASWTRPENIHLTLKFFGNVEQDKIPKVSQAMARSVEGLAAFRFRLAGTGAFPKHGSPRVLWIGVEDSHERLAALQQRLEEECEKEGFPKETRPFNPHLTIARLRKPRGARELARLHQSMAFEGVETSVSELLLFRSESSSSGSKYTVISRQQLSEML